MEGETNRDDSFPESLDSPPEGSPGSDVDRLASDGNRHGSVESHDGSNVQEQTDAVREEILVCGTASRSLSLTTSSSASCSDHQLSSSSGVGRLLSRRFTFKSGQLVRNVSQNSAHFCVRGNDSTHLSISLRVPSSDQQRNTTNLAPRLVPGNQQCTGLSEEQIRGRLKERKHTMERCSICLEDYDEGDDLGILDCKHEFHKTCIKTWLLLNNRCPVCIRKALEIGSTSFE